MIIPRKKKLTPNQLRKEVMSNWAHSEVMFLAAYTAHYSGLPVDFLLGGDIEVDGIIFASPFKAIEYVHKMKDWT